MRVSPLGAAKALSRQFPNRLRIFEQVLRAAVEVGQGRRGIDAQDVINGGHQILKGHGTM
jgi:hypothetical protein